MKNVVLFYFKGDVFFHSMNIISYFQNFRMVFVIVVLNLNIRNFIGVRFIVLFVVYFREIERLFILDGITEIRTIVFTVLYRVFLFEKKENVEKILY